MYVSEQSVVSINMPTQCFNSGFINSQLYWTKTSFAKQKTLKIQIKIKLIKPTSTPLVSSHYLSNRISINPIYDHALVHNTCLANCRCINFALLNQVYVHIDHLIWVYFRTIKYQHLHMVSNKEVYK